MKKLYLLAALLLIATTAAYAMPGFQPTGNWVDFQIGKHWKTPPLTAPKQRPPSIPFGD